MGNQFEYKTQIDQHDNSAEGLNNNSLVGRITKLSENKPKEEPAKSKEEEDKNACEIQQVGSRFSFKDDEESDKTPKEESKKGKKSKKEKKEKKEKKAKKTKKEKKSKKNKDKSPKKEEEEEDDSNKNQVSESSPDNNSVPKRVSLTYSYIGIIYWF